MSKVRSFQLMTAAVIILFYPLISQAAEKRAHAAKGVDVIRIDLPKKSAGNEMPSVEFLHTHHTQAADGNCAACHVQEQNRFIFKFKRTDQAASMELYHENCIACHIEKKNINKTSGPLEAECRSCHGAKREGSDSVWTKIAFDKSLHFIHENSKAIKPAVLSQADNCSACHHKYNTKTKKTYYIKGEEESCTYCHKNVEQEGIRTMRNASHDSCVACHIKLTEKEIDAGPSTCIGCHDKKEQAKIKKADNITRLKRNQPDEAFLTGLTSGGDNPRYLMKPVAFNHKAHENQALSCKVCHHDTLKKCSDCHTPKGNTNGKFIRLEQAMHAKGSEQSCVGCHTGLTSQTDCAGCHSLMPDKGMDKNTCVSCHNAPDTSVVPDEGMKKAAAKKIIQELAGQYSQIETEKIPEKVTISDLADEYKPSEFPHRQVVNAIFKRVEKNGLANTFHQDQQTLCAGCHHNSPKSMDPPKCASCHGKTTDLANGKPHLKGAYHGQCITCHQKMQVKTVLATDCIKCHEKK